MSKGNITISGRFLCMPAILLLLLVATAPIAAGDWKGVDEAVVEKVAQEHGREAKEPLIDPGDGDILLFVFLLAGAAGGFAAGYYWRMLTERKFTGNGSAHRP